MKQYTYFKNGLSFKRISRNMARIAYNNGLTVVFCPANLRPDSIWEPGVNISKNSKSSGGRSFETILNEFVFYNCRGRETGRYAAFYIPTRRVDRFTGEAPTAESLGTVEAYDMRFLQD